MAKIPIEYMPSSNAGETPQSTNATIVHSKQRQPPLYRIVPITLEVGFGPSSASYVITYNENYNFTGKLDITAENETSNQHFFYKIDTIRNENSPAVFLTAAQELLSSLASDITSGSSRINRYASNTTLQWGHD